MLIHRANYFLNCHASLIIDNFLRQIEVGYIINGKGIEKRNTKVNLRHDYLREDS